MRTIILASQSPRRKELLAKMGLEFEAIASGYDEVLDDSRPPETVAVELGLGKARDVASRYPEALVIGSDTIVAIGNRQLGKAADEAEAWQMWRDMTQQPVKVVTSVAVVCNAEGIELTGYETALVYFKPFDKAAVGAYLATGDYRGKAAAVSIQGGVGPLIDHIEYTDGNFDTIVGLPTQTLARLLKQVEAMQLRR